MSPPQDVAARAEGAASVAGHSSADADEVAAAPARRWFAVWAGLIAVAFGGGAVLRAAGGLPVDALPPLHAHGRLLVVPLLPAAVVALAGVAALPIAARRLPWPLLLGTAWLASAVWALTLQLPDGIGRPLTAPTEYLAGLPAMGDDPLGWLHGFTRHLQEYPTHVKGHPPLPMLILWIVRWIGLGDATWAAALVIAAGASASAAIAVTIRTVADENLARRAVPFLILAPTAVWVATSMDALFLGAAAWGVALTAQATTRGRGEGPRPPWGAIPRQSLRAGDRDGKRFHRLWITRLWKCGPARELRLVPRGGRVVTGGRAPDVRSAPYGGAAADRRVRGMGSSIISTVATAFAGGALIGSLPYLSYGLVSILALPLAVLLLTRPRRSVLLAFCLGCLTVPLAFTLGGFNWLDGVIATHAAWAAGAGSRRPYGYFLVGDLAVLALVIGPMAAQKLPYVLSRARTPNPEAALGILTAATLAGVLALDLSGITRGEVERIWLPYAAWMTATAAVYRPPARRVLIAQAVTALLIQALVRSPW